MKTRLLTITILLFLLAACSPNQAEAPLQIETSSDNQTLAADPNPPLPPTNTLVPEATLTPTSTPGDQIVVLTHETPALVLTSANLQLENNRAELTAAANQISTLEHQSNILKTQLAAASTQAAENSTSSSSSPSSTQYEIPSYVHTVVTTSKAIIHITKRDNNAGYPIMEMLEPRVIIPPGTLTWVYKDKIRTDGGAYFYESYDPDGQSDLKVYFRMQDIQIRLPSGDPDPSNFSSKVAKAEFTEKAVAHYANGYDDGNKPIMEVREPRIIFNSGDVALLITEFVVATGGSHWYPVYDPDGNPSIYVKEDTVEFLLVWD